MSAPRLWIPGPTHVRPELLAELARPQIGHRSRSMTELIERLDPPLRLAFGLEGGSDAHVAVHTCSATALMEASLLGVGPRVLCVTVGAFGERWREIAETLGKDVHALGGDWGAAVEPAAIAQAVEEHGPFDAVTLVSNETSTGVRTPLSEVGDALRAHPETRLLVDLVSYIAGAPVDLDRNRIDFGFAGVQKAFALPSGVAVAGVSDRYLTGARALERRSFYLDPVRIVEGHEQRKTLSTPAIPHYYALAQQLEDITNGVTLPDAERDLSGAAAWTARFARHERMRVATRDWAARHGLELLPAERFASPTVSCLKAGSVDVRALIADLKERGHEIGNGYGRLKDRTFRIGHMGDHTEADLTTLLAAADEALAVQAPGSPDAASPGAGTPASGARG